MIARTGYMVSSVSYVVFLTLDWLRPGFVVNVFSPHLFLLAAMVFGFFWARKSRVDSQISFLHLSLFLLPLSFLFAIFTWSEGRAFGDWRILVSLIAFGMPWLIVKQLLTNT